MKLQLDTTNKTIKVEGSVNLNELFDALRKLLPQGEWKEFSLEANTTIVWTNPITIQPWVYPYYPTYPWWNSPVITCEAGTGKLPDYNGSTQDSVQYSLNSGVYNIQV
jgi:hypothetical protein